MAKLKRPQEKHITVRNTGTLLHQRRKHFRRKAFIHKNAYFHIHRTLTKQRAQHIANLIQITYILGTSLWRSENNMQRRIRKNNCRNKSGTKDFLRHTRLIVTIPQPSHMESRIHQIHALHSLAFQPNTYNINLALVKNLRRCRLFKSPLVILAQCVLTKINNLFNLGMSNIQTLIRRRRPICLHHLTLLDIAEPCTSQLFTHFYFHGRILLFTIKYKRIVPKGTPSTATLSLIAKSLTESQIFYVVRGKKELQHPIQRTGIRHNRNSRKASTQLCCFTRKRCYPRR